MYQHLDKVKDLKAEKLFKKLEKAGHSDEEILEAKELLEKLKSGEGLEELFEDIDESNLDPTEDLNPQDDLFGFGESLFEDEQSEEDFSFEFEQAFDAFHNQEKDQELELSKLLKTTSINKLFRRIARAIHPDLTDNEIEKEQRHTQMSRLLRAREEKDIAYILQCYHDTFGQLPENFPQSDYDKLTTIINRKIQQLHNEKDATLMENPFHAQLHEWFAAKNRKQEARNIDRYISELRTECEGYDIIRSSITSIPALREHLEIRYYATNGDELY